MLGGDWRPAALFMLGLEYTGEQLQTNLRAGLGPD